MIGEPPISDDGNVVVVVEIPSRRPKSDPSNPGGGGCDGVVRRGVPNSDPSCCC